MSVRSFGPYLLIKKLGEGGTSSAYLGRRRDDPSRRLIAIKRLKSELASDPLSIARLKHEAAIAVRVESPHLAQVLDVGAVAGEHFIAMELVEGWSVARVLKQHALEGRRLPVEQVVALGLGGLAGLTRLHEAIHPETGEALGAVHRDISPGNLVIRPDRRLVLIDLGLGTSTLKEWATRTGLLIGTPGYSSPEQVLGDRVDHRADLYSLSVILFELLTLSYYVSREGALNTLKKVLEANYRPISSFRDDVPPELDRVLERALSLRPEQRYQTAFELGLALKSAVPGAVGAAGELDLSPVLERDLVAETAEIAALLDGDPDESGEHEPTEIYAARTLSGIKEASTITEGREVLRGPSHTRPISLLEGPARPRSIAWTAAALVATVAITAVVVATRPRPPAAVPVSDPIIEPAVVPAPPPPILVSPRAPPEPETPPLPPPGKRSKDPPAPRPDPIVAPAIPQTTKVPTRARLTALIRRAQALSAARPETTGAVTGIISSASVWMRSSDELAAEGALQRLDDQLRALELKARFPE